jgi:hypothetical protein
MGEASGNRRIPGWNRIAYGVDRICLPPVEHVDGFSSGRTPIANSILPRLSATDGDGLRAQDRMTLSELHPMTPRYVIILLTDLRGGGAPA